MVVSIYNFSKLRKICVNLAVSNNRVFQIPVIYVRVNDILRGKKVYGGEL